MMRTICRHLWKSYCAFAPGGVGPIESLLEHFEDEVMAHIEGKGCPFAK
jgi:NADH-quinone oxidoreductase subunit F